MRLLQSGRRTNSGQEVTRCIASSVHRSPHRCELPAVRVGVRQCAPKSVRSGAWYDSWHTRSHTSLCSSNQTHSLLCIIPHSSLSSSRRCPPRPSPEQPLIDTGQHTSAPTTETGNYHHPHSVAHSHALKNRTLRRSHRYCLLHCSRLDCSTSPPTTARTKHRYHEVAAYSPFGTPPTPSTRRSAATTRPSPEIQRS